jgi:hypothetical protein
MTNTEDWFSDSALAQLYDRYRTQFPVESLSYATVTDFCDSCDFLNPLATASGDLKDVQRPWILKAILGRVPHGGNVLEIGACEPWVANLLSRLGYKVWVVDLYDGPESTPLEYERFSSQYPNIRFIRDRFSDQLIHLPEQSFDCIYSISALQHMSVEDLFGLVAGLKKFLRSLCNLDQTVRLFGLSKAELDRKLAMVDQDVETYFLSAESHNRLRGTVPYDEFPMRICIAVQLVSEAADIPVVQRAVVQSS